MTIRHYYKIEFCYLSYLFFMWYNVYKLNGLLSKCSHFSLSYVTKSELRQNIPAGLINIVSSDQNKDLINFKCPISILHKKVFFACPKKRTDNIIKLFKQLIIDLWTYKMSDNRLMILIDLRFNIFTDLSFWWFFNRYSCG
jgi:hypothetical protein